MDREHESRILKRGSFLTGSQLTVDSGHVSSLGTLTSDATSKWVWNDNDRGDFIEAVSTSLDNVDAFNNQIEDYGILNVQNLDLEGLDSSMYEDDIALGEDFSGKPSVHEDEFYSSHCAGLDSDNFTLDYYSLDETFETHKDGVSNRTVKYDGESDRVFLDDTVLTDDDRLSINGVLTTRTIMTHTDAENEETAMETDIEVTPRGTPKVHPAVDPPICEACMKLDMTFCDPQCNGCKLVISNKDTTIAQLFAVIRQWTPQTQQNIKTLVDEILNRGANVNDRDGLTDMTILQYAAKAGAHGIGDPDSAAQTVQLLVDKSADVFIRCRWTNMTALHYAAYFDVPDVIRILLKTSRCVDIESVCTEFDHGTPLHIAAINLATQAAKCLIQNGANTLCKDGFGRTALECLPDQANADKDSEMGKLVGKMRKMLSDAEPASPKQPPPNYDLVPSKVTLQSIGVKLGDRVIVGGIKGGTLRYCGPTEFAAGVWAGIELDESIGKNDGSVGNISYFQCPKDHGIFAPINKISREGNPSFRRTSVRAGRRSSTPPNMRHVTHPKVDVSRVTAKVNTGLHASPSQASECTELEIGDRVLVAGQRKGTVKFIGETQFSPGTWYGIELDRSVGKNDGAVNGVRYFTCRPRRGVFAPISRLKLLMPGNLVSSNESIDSSASADTWTDREKRLSGRQRGGSLSSLNLSSSPSKTDPNRPNSSNSGSHRRSSRGGLSDSEQYLKVGMSCFCNNELGSVRYIGPTDFAEGIWIGVELRTPKGKNDGTVQGMRFFHCKPNHGLLVRPSKISVRGINGAKLLGDIHTSTNTDQQQPPVP